jgi:hypothetical protein
MDHLFDEFSKSLTESVPRRESLRRLGAVFAGAVLGPLGLDSAWAGAVDPCARFCQCRNSKQQSQCLTACRTCAGNTSRLAGSCGSYTCCPVASCKGVCSNLKSDPNCGACGNNCRLYGETCCGSYCADLKNDIFNCGRCGNVCAEPGPDEAVACLAGSCVYECADGKVDCLGACTDVNSDPDNCGACGNACPASLPFCTAGVCTADYCNGADLQTDYFNCGTCGNICYGFDYCMDGICQSDPNPVGG